jgi:DHA1 family bicyclomycin/chloramphenicol resistance-like MFS transporter
MVAGNVVSSRLAGKLSPRAVVSRGIVVMLAAAAANVILNVVMPPRLPWVVLPMAVYATGLFVAFASLQLIALELFPDRKGMAASCQSFLVTLGMGFTAGVSAPLLWDTPLHLAAGMLGNALVGLALYRWESVRRS